MMYESTAQKIIDNYEAGLNVTEKISDYEMLCLALSYLAMIKRRIKEGW